MDFFAAQEHARRNSRFLIIWFAIAVIGIIAAVYIAILLATGLGAAQQSGQALTLWDPELFAMSAGGIGGVILLGSGYKVLALSRNGGPAIATELGGRLVSRSSSDPLERRLINVVDEMAIASGIAAPAVYILDAEQGINAFAAGSRITDGVVAVTRGTLEQLSRDELQGVVAHEFSHILNGDMRLNLKLIGVLHGILLLTLAGRVMMRSARRSDRGAAPFIIGGLALVVVGYIGVLCGKMIKSGVSRQREYLADAAAVQFTRNPSGIAGALKKIAGIGSEIHHPRAEEASHMFFGSSAHFSRLLATHPPIEARIKRLDPSFDPGRSSKTVPHAAAASATPEASAGFSPASFAASIGALQPAHVDLSQALLEKVPELIMDAAHQTGGARALVFALLLSSRTEIQDKQLSGIETHFGAATREEAYRLWQWTREQDATMRLPLLDLALPTLSQTSTEARAQTLDGADRLIQADGRTSLFEYVLRRLLHGSFSPTNARKLGSVSLKTLKSDAARLLALLASAGDTEDPELASAFEAATAVAPFEGPWDLKAAKQAITVKELDRILAHLADTKPAFRKKIVEAAATAVTHDGKVTATEAELLRAVCQALDCPAPPLLTK